MFGFRVLKRYKERKVNLQFKKEIEPQEIFLDSSVQKKEIEIGVSEGKIEVPLSQKILWGLFLFFLVLVIALFGRTFQLQVFLEDKYLSLSEKNRLTTSLIVPVRGVIYDSKGEQLVLNGPAFDLICDKKNLPKEKGARLKIIKEVSNTIEIDFESLKNQISDANSAQVLVTENISHEALILLETKLEELPGFEIKKNTVRQYPNGENFSHLVGYTSRISQEEFRGMEDYLVTDYIGKTGLEKFYEEVLRGKSGEIQIERDTFGRQVGESVEFKPESGKSLILYLDAELQETIIQSLKKSLVRVGSQKAAVIAMNPKSGGILAMISLPNFDNNKFSQGISQQEFREIQTDPYDPLFFRAVSGTYPSGSTIKPLIASAALQEKLIAPTKKIHCQGNIQIENPWNPEIVYTFKDWTIHGWTDMRKAIAQSCNVYFYTIGGGYKDFQGLGVDRIEKYLKLFGWGEKTGIDISEEKKGLIPSRDWKKEYFERPEDKIWVPGDTYNLSIGQGYLSATPLQVVTSFAAIVNGGKILIPHLVKEIISGPLESPESIQEIQPEVLRKDFISAENFQVVREGMREAVLYGSSVLLNDLPVKAAAKTGTAQTSKEGYFHNWVTVFAPYENPEIILTVLVEDVEGEQSAVLPVAKEVLEWYFTQELP